MSKSSLLWIFIFGVLTLLALRRSSWGIGLYLFSFYFSPHHWWWGKDLANIFGHRFSLAAALIFGVAAIIGGVRLRPPERKVLIFLLLYAFGASLVHLLNANNPERSAKGLNLLWKHLGLFFLLVTTIKNRQDWNIFLYSIIIGSLHVGYAVRFNGAGDMIKGRLELNFAPGVSDSNFLAGILAMSLPIVGAKFFIGNKAEKVISLIATPLVLDTIIRANSRGGFLSLLVGGGWFFLNAIFIGGRLRKLSIYVLILGTISCLFLLGDERIIERFKTAFEPQQQREASAQSRIEFWRSAMKMLNDHPWGLGGEAAFKSDIGAQYIAHLAAEGYVSLSERGKSGYGYRAVHNGYLDILCSWGFQSVFFYGIAHLIALLLLRKSTLNARTVGDWRASFLGLCISTSFIIQYVNSFFISSLDGEWCFWLLALALVHDRLFGEHSILAEDLETMDDNTAEPEDSRIASSKTTA